MADCRAAAPALRKARDSKLYWAMQSQLWKGLLKVRRTSLAAARQKRAKNKQDARWYEKEVRRRWRKMPVYKMGMEALKEDRKKLILEFEELRGHCTDIANLRAAAPAKSLKRPLRTACFNGRFVYLDAGPIIPRYTVQV